MREFLIKDKCRECGSVDVYSHGSTAKGTARKRCNTCGKTWQNGYLRSPKEAAEAKALMEYANYHPHPEVRKILSNCLIHIPNGGFRKPGEAKHLKAQGVKPGISDYFLAYPARPYHGMWLELKRSNRALSKLSAEQKEWLLRMESFGYKSVVAYGAQDAIQHINQYLSFGDVR